MGLFDFFKKNKKDEQDEYRNDRQNDDEIQKQDEQQSESDGTVTEDFTEDHENTEDVPDYEDAHNTADNDADGVSEQNENMYVKESVTDADGENTDGEQYYESENQPESEPGSVESETAEEPEQEYSDETENPQENAEISDEAVETLSEEQPKEQHKGFFERLKEGLKRTRDSVFGQINDIFKSFVKVDEDMLEELEEVLIASDVGINITSEIIDELRDRIKSKHITEPEDAKNELIEILESTIGEDEPLDVSKKPTVILVIGVNGVGKTTSIAKLANKLKNEGKSVALAAADTFRAAAIDQLEIWANRVGVPIIKHSEGADPAAVVFDACSYVKSHGTDVLIVDTAGRLHVKKNLMDELAKINRVIDRELNGAGRETLLILDAVTGQNAINQAKEFMHTSAITGIILTKLDGTAKGGIIISVKKELGIPVKFIGVGEQMDDLQTFNGKNFVKALFEE